MTAFVLVAVIGFEVTTLLSFGYAPSGEESLARIVPAELVFLANGDRERYGAAPLIENPLLARAAELAANDMAARGYFSHASPEGEPPWRWLEQVGYRYAVAGQNLAINFNDSKDVEDAWMNSPPHSANILDNGFTETGSGVASGTYRGREMTFVVQFFARPLPPKETN